MRRTPTRRTVERAIDRLEDRGTGDLTRDAEAHKVYAGVDLSQPSGTEAAQERVTDARTVHLAPDRETAEAALGGARVIGWSRPADRDEDGSTEDGDHE